MLLLRGSRSKLSRKKLEIQHTCQACQTNKQYVRNLVTYFHIWFIPFFKKNSQAFVQCAHCQTSIKFNYNEHKDFIVKREELSTFKYTWSYYFGLYIIGAFLLLLILGGML